MNDNWIQQAIQKIAASAPQDDKAITEAFAQQAYTAVGNRDREIMRDPYMLGFEIVTKNEENTRLVGVFAFLVSGEILLVPVFYLNGQIKGQDLLYRKGVNRFVPNTDKWVSYLLSRGEDVEGRPVDRRALDARIHLDLRQMAGSRIHKQSSEELSITQLWKEAMEAWAVTPPEELFADMLVTTGMQKQAAELAAKLPVFAEMVELSGALDKQAAAPVEKQAEEILTIYSEPADGWSETRLEEFYKRGFALEDSRKMKGLSSAYVRSDMERSWASIVEPGVRKVTDIEGNVVKCLWTPVLDPLDWPAENEGVGSAYDNDRRLGSSYMLVILEGPDKGRSVTYRSGTTPSDIPVFQTGEENPDDQALQDKKPKAGGTYLVWLPDLKIALNAPFIVRSIKKSDGRTILNAGQSNALVINSDLESNMRNLRPGHGIPMTVGADAQFIPITCQVSYDQGRPELPENISWADAEAPTTFRPLCVGRMDEALMTIKTAGVEIRPTGHGRADVLLNGKRRAEDLELSQLVWKLAAGLHLPVDEALELAEVGIQSGTRFNVISPAQQIKLAAAYSGKTEEQIANNLR